VFVVPVGGRFFGNSTAAWTILIEGLLVVAARRLGTRAVSELRKRERLFLELGIAVDGGDASRG
jgi:hypothetical protein